MPIEIPSEFRPFVDQELKTGLYRSDQEVVNKALEMLRREREEALAGIREGLADAEAGRVQSLDGAFEDLRVEFGLPPDK
jgi:putative addiction module CopG family antidote